MYLLDTNHCSRIINGDSAVISQLQQNASAGVATSAIVRGELIPHGKRANQGIPGESESWEGDRKRSEAAAGKKTTPDI